MDMIKNIGSSVNSGGKHHLRVDNHTRTSRRASQKERENRDSGPQNREDPLNTHVVVPVLEVSGVPYRETSLQGEGTGT